ncbi:uncharacterized protein [Rutidosis leptorrhynchoides]|uniref:uncharacterized protein n=1 Tax=Rutidosis leptorrhynchoides TaxID=125765 RepID=UPI003A9A1E69
MECNKDEANRAKEIAENKFLNKDMNGAKKFALKAKTLYPTLDGINQLISVLDVYVAAENKINGELDYYEILGVGPATDDDTVKKQYRKLALSLHPDKNKSVGAEGAFQYVSEAWNLLSDKEKRSMYDHRRNVFMQRVQVHHKNGGSRPPNGFNCFTKSTAARKVTPTNAKDTTVKAKDTTSKAKSTTTKAKDSYATSKDTTVTAKDSTAKTKGTTAKAKYTTTEAKDTATKAKDSNPQVMDTTNVAKDTVTKAKGTGTKAKGTTSKAKGTSSKAKGTVIETKDNVRTGHTSLSNGKTVLKTFWTVCMRCKLQYEFGRMYVNRNLLCPTCYGPFRAIEVPPPNINGSAGNNILNQETCKIAGGETGQGTSSKWAPFKKAYSAADVDQAANLVQQTYEKVKREREEAQANTKREKALRRKLDKKTAKLSNSDAINGPIEVKKDVSDMGIKKGLIKKATMEIKKKLNEWSSETVKDWLPNEESKNLETESVPDPDFYDFDIDRSEKCFEEGQVWAAYCDDDEMPRTYAMIEKVITLTPFKMKICWYNLKPEYSGAYGEFKAGKHETVSSPNYFSHKANFTKRENGSVWVFPKKGDVCALYRNGKKSGFVKHAFEIMEVDAYDQETGGVTVTPLVKVAGYKTVFHRHVNTKETKVVMKTEMGRFSHQIPAYLITGRESLNAIKGCYELDPAAVPREFLHVIKNVNEGENGDDQMLETFDGLEDLKEADNMDVEN